MTKSQDKINKNNNNHKQQKTTKNKEEEVAQILYMRTLILQHYTHSNKHKYYKIMQTAIST